MEAYQSFARVYDLFMDDVDYGTWSRFLTEKIKKIWNPGRPGAGSGLRDGKNDGTALRGRL